MTTIYNKTKVINDYLNDKPLEEIKTLHHISYKTLIRLLKNTPKREHIRKGEKHFNWKGEKVGYIALHEWISNYKPKPKLCENCIKNKPYDLANISGEYKRDIKDFKWLCRSCHMKEDKRLDKLKYKHFLWRKKKGHTLNKMKGGISK